MALSLSQAFANKRNDMKNLLFILFAFIGLPVISQQQAASSLTARYEGGDIILQYLPPVTHADSLTINVYRKSAQRDERIRADRKIAAKTVWLYADTFTRRNPGVYQYRIEIKGDAQSEHNSAVWAYAYSPDVIPVAGEFKVQSAKGSNAVLLTWQIADAYMVNSIVVQRSRKKDTGYKPIATLKGNETNYTDRVNDTNEAFFYRIDMIPYHSERVYQSASVFVMPDFTINPAKVQNINASQINKQIIVSWQSDDEYSRAFYVFKRSQNQGDFIPASLAITADKTQKYQWADTASTLSNNMMYQYIVLAESNSFHKSQPSDTVTVSYKNKNIPLYAPQDLQILTANDTTYHLVWSTDSLQNENYSGFQVYLKRRNDNDYRLIPNGMVTSNLNYVAIPQPDNGDSYKIKATQGTKESNFSLPFTYRNAQEKNFGPKYLKAAVTDGLLTVKWLNDEREKFRAFKLYRWNGKMFTLIEEISPDKDKVATRSYTPGELNVYKLVTINLQGEENNGSTTLQVN